MVIYVTLDDLINRCLTAVYYVDTESGKQEKRDWLGMDRKHIDNVLELALTGRLG